MTKSEILALGCTLNDFYSEDGNTLWSQATGHPTPPWYQNHPPQGQPPSSAMDPNPSAQQERSVPQRASWAQG